MIGGLGLLEVGSHLAEAVLGEASAVLPLPSPDCPAPCLEGRTAALPPKHNRTLTLTANVGRQGWGFTPGNVIMQGNVLMEINALGFRGPVPATRVPGELRLLSLGDSSVFGFGVQDGETFHELAATELSAELGRPVSAINGAIPGHDSAQSLAVLRDLGPKVEPDVVLIASLWSDLYHQATASTWEKPRWSATYRLLSRALSPWLKARTFGWLDPEHDAGTPGLGRVPRSSLRDYHLNLVALVQEGRALGAQPLIFRLPAPIDLDPAGAPDWIGDYRLVQELVAHDEQVPLSDGPAWMAAHDASLLDYYDQVHPSASGHRKLASLLVQDLEPVLRASQVRRPSSGAR